MPGAVIVANQATGAGAGSPGVARNDLWLSQAIELVVGTSGNASVLWELLGKPAGSSATITDAEETTAGLTPDTIGTYRVRLTTNGGGPGNVQTLVFRVRYDNAGSLAERGWALPAVGEVAGEANYGGNVRGWAQPFEYIFEDIRTALVADGGYPLIEQSGSMPDNVASFAADGPIQVLFGDRPAYKQTIYFEDIAADIELDGEGDPTIVGMIVEVSDPYGRGATQTLVIDAGASPFEGNSASGNIATFAAFGRIKMVAIDNGSYIKWLVLEKTGITFS